jgi:hypothetical protein
MPSEFKLGDKFRNKWIASGEREGWGTGGEMAQTMNMNK